MYEDNIYDEIYDNIFNIDAEEAAERLNDELNDVIQKMKDVEPETTKKQVKKRILTTQDTADNIEEFENNNNILNAEARKRCRECIQDCESEILTPPVPTTMTLGGYINNVNFHEEQFIDQLYPTEDIFRIKCNYGDLKHESYYEDEPEKKTNRGRKKKDKNKKPRKIQGDGSCFNSQITFYVPSDSKIYKIKVFRNGELQIPGAKPEILDDILEKMQLTVDLISECLDNEDVKLEKIIPVMKNYKFSVNLDNSQLIELSVLKELLLIHKYMDEGFDYNSAKIMMKEYLCDCPDNKHSKTCEYEEYEENVYQGNIEIDDTPMPEHPQISDVKYSGEETRLSIKFSTPIAKKIKKKARVNIFTGGKINILGAFDETVTKQIFHFLQELFDRYYTVLVVHPDSDEEYELIDDYSDNIENDIDIYTAYDICKHFNDVFANIHFDEEAAEDILAFAETL